MAGHGDSHDDAHDEAHDTDADAGHAQAPGGALDAQT
jgi:hypothetical protein